MNKNLVNVLAATPLFAGIAPDVLAVMLGCLQPKLSTHSKNSFIAVEGEPFSGLGILLAGEAAVVKENVAGSRSVLTVLGQGDMFGEMIAFSARTAWPASVFAQSECSVVLLPPEKITGTCPQACDGHHQLVHNMLLIVSERALMLNRKVEYLTIKGMRTKIVTYLLEQHKLQGKKTFILPLKRNDMADFLNVSRTALSRELGRLRDEGLIDFFRSSIKLQDIENLKKAVE
ncbi:MAG TPA: Crp/Fnr family transcriptional regulator [Selenomonadales bacterium]|nr:Crp/Fnr family transcriptional regulator [Selenomonadales bacterium]